MESTEHLKLNIPDYNNLADIEVLNVNFRIIDKNAKETKGEVDSKEPKIQVKKTGFNLDKTDLTENDTNKLFTAKGALNLFDSLSELINSLSTSIGTVSKNLNNHILKKVSISEDGHMAKEDKIKLDGIVVGANKYILPEASQSILGGVKVGANLNMTNGVLSGAPSYALPTASPSVLGGVKIGSNLSISNGVLSANVGPTTCFIPIGFIIMTDDNKLNPATLFPGTTWGRIAENRSIRGATASEGVGTIGGSDSVGIAHANLPAVNLWAHDHSHTRGGMEITGTFDINGTTTTNSSASGAFSMINLGLGFQHGSAGDNHKFGSNFYASRAWTGATSGSSTTCVPLEGSNVALNVTNAFYKMHIWKRLT